MKFVFSTLLLLSCAFIANAQNDAATGGGMNGNGNAYSNGNIPSQYEQNQNRPDSTLRSSDTTYQHQQWNSGASQQQNKSGNNSSSKSKTPKTGTATKKKK